jgi:hypothetical protein
MTATNKFSSYDIDLVQVNGLPTTSAKMRHLYGILGTYYKTASFMNTMMPRADGKEWRVQHVRNVVVTPVKTPKA